MSRSTNLISIATQNTEEKTKLDKLHMLEEAANINIVSLQNIESSTFQKAAKIEILKHQLESGSSRSNTNFNSNLKYIEATASLEAAANHENEKLINHTTLEEKNDTKNKEIEVITTSTNPDSSSVIANQNTKNPTSYAATSSISSSSFDDTDTTSSSSSYSSDESDQSYEKAKRKHIRKSAKKKKCRKIKSYFCIPTNRVGLILGKGQEIIQRIISESKTHCYLSKREPIDAKDSKIILKGTRPAVRKAKAMIMEELYAPNEGQYTDYMTIPSRKCGMIIGKGGEVIKGIMENSSARCDIDMNSWNSGRDKYVIIRGTAKAIDVAKDMISEILDDDSKYTVEDYIIVPTKKLGMIMGTKGETIKCISRQARVRCELDSKDFSDVKERKMYIKGKRDSVNKAKQLIFEMMYAPKENEYTDYISIPIDKCGLLIGRKGETIKEINEVSGAICEVDANVSSDTEEKHVIIQGKIKAIENAKELIKEKLDLLYPHEKLLSVKNRCKSIINGTRRSKRRDTESENDSFKTNYLEFSGKRSRSDPSNKCSGNKKVCLKEEPYDYHSSKISSAAMEYRKEWAEYYRSMGMIAEANLIDPLQKHL